MNRLTYLKNVTTLQFSSEKCNGCTMCTQVCPHAVFMIKNKKAFVQQKDLCMECGACALNCQTGAITVKSGVGCVSAIITGLIKGTEPACGCSSSNNCC